jgi:hypothetical protein
MQVIDAAHLQTPDRLCADPDGIVVPFTSYLPVASYTSDPDNEGEILGCWEYLGQAIETDPFALFIEHTLPLSRSDEKGRLFYRRLVKRGEEEDLFFWASPPPAADLQADVGHTGAHPRTVRKAAPFSRLPVFPGRPRQVSRR